MADSTAPEKRGKKATQTKPPTAHAAEERIVSLPLAELHPFPNHPFKVRDDETMHETAESIKQYGVLVPAIVRPREEGGYEIVAGHRRKHACELAGLETMPVIVRNLDADTATIIMVDSNLQRENILPSERAQAYKMKLGATRSYTNTIPQAKALWALRSSGAKNRGFSSCKKTTTDILMSGMMG